MITFKQLLENREQHEMIFQTLEQECAPFIRDMGGMESIVELADHRPRLGLMRGLQERIQGIAKKGVRADRVPRDLSKTAHSVADDWFFEKFGYRYRSAAAFCTDSYGQAKAYGQPYLVFPIGNYKVCKSWYAEDLLTVMSEHEYDNILPSERKEFEPKIRELLEEQDYKQGHLNAKMFDQRGAMFMTSNEIMLACKAYYVMDFHTITLQVHYSKR